MTRWSLGTTYMVVNPQEPVAHIENFAIFPFILANIAGISLFRAACGGIYADLFDSHPRNCSTDHQLLDLFGAFENVVNLCISMPAFYGIFEWLR